MDFQSRNDLWTRRNLLRAMSGVAVLAATGTLAACGGADAKTQTVTLTNEMRFEPAMLTIKNGEGVTWKNEGSMVHTVTTASDKLQDESMVEVPSGAEPWDSGLIDVGATWSHTFTVPGRYRYVCLPHLIAGMTGEIVVEA
jgi:plastocyanin